MSCSPGLLLSKLLWLIPHGSGASRRGGKESNPGPQRGANDLLLVDGHPGFFFFFCMKYRWTTSNKNDFLYGTGLKSIAYPGYVSSHIKFTVGCLDLDKSPLWFSFTQTFLHSQSVFTKPCQTWRVMFYIYFTCRGRARCCASRARPSKGKWTCRFSSYQIQPWSATCT